MPHQDSIARVDLHLHSPAGGDYRGDPNTTPGQIAAACAAGQVTEYASLVHEGLTLSSSAYGSAFYLTTGFHGLHVTGGLIAFLFVLATTYVTKRFTHDQATRAIVTSYYWHFVDVVWIALFFMIYILK